MAVFLKKAVATVIVLAQAAHTFDRVILDCPPHLGFADILVISRQVGGMILVAEMGEATRNGLRKFKESMQNVYGTVLGCIVNTVGLQPALRVQVRLPVHPVRSSAGDAGRRRFAGPRRGGRRYTCIRRSAGRAAVEGRFVLKQVKQRRE